MIKWIKLFEFFSGIGDVLMSGGSEGSKDGRRRPKVEQREAELRAGVLTFCDSYWLERR